MKKSRCLLVCLAVIGVIMLMACGDREAHEEEPESNSIRIYDVEPQVKENWKNQQHYLRVGVLCDFEDYTNEKAPFANQIEKIEKKTGAEIEYVVLDNWEELQRAEEEFKDKNVTEIILFNNTYEGSLIKEATSGRYANMEAALGEYGFYDEDAYNQVVMEAGRMNNQQVLVPILYNVPGMIQGEKEYYVYEDWKEIAYAHAENVAIDFEDFILMLKEAMILANVEEMELPFMSNAFLEGKVDLYVTAAGGQWESYANQFELFELLYNYLNTYQETQVECKEDKVSNQALYGKHVENYQYTPFREKLGDKEVISYLPDKVADELQIERNPLYDEESMLLWELVMSMLDRTEYFVECSSAEKIAFHSVLGLLGYRDYYGHARTSGIGTEFEVSKVENMKYWPIGMLGSGNTYAAQPICYAAVMDGGNTRLAAKVLQAMMDQPVEAKYGISVCNESKDLQLEDWAKEYDRMGNIRKIHMIASAIPERQLSEIKQPAYWNGVMGNISGFFLEDKEIYAAQVSKQIDNLSIAQIPDREILAIWQDTLTESVEQGLSAQAGFEMLCERMDEWYEE